ncbi:MAG: 30S ribosomal protein S12 methylthiotransferase accessory factor YcaO [bacterium]
MTLTYIPGKDAPLEDSIASMQKKLKALGFDIVEASWLNPVPHVWSVHIHDRQCPQLFTNGKGATREAALASALGEYFERLSTNYFFADYFLPDADEEYGFVHHPEERWFEGDDEALPPKLLADDGLRTFYDPDKELTLAHLRDINSPLDREGVCALPYTRVSDQTTLWFPVNLIANLYVSNGMSAGNTAAEARVQALSEILERYVKFKVIAEGIALPEIPQQVVASYPGIKAAVDSLQEAGFGLHLKDASLGGRYPVINVTLLSPDGGCFASFGAHPCFEVALERTVTELLQGRDLEALNGFPPPTLDMETVASAENLETHFIDSSGSVHWSFFQQEPDYPFTAWDASGDTSKEFSYLCNLIQADGKEIYILDHEHLGVYSCRIIVPSMSEIYPPDDLVWDNSNSGIHLRSRLLNLASASEQECADILETLEDEGFDDQQPLAALLHLLPDAGSCWEQIRVGELKCYLALASEDFEAALHWCTWTLEFTPDNTNQRTMACLQHWLGLIQAFPETAHEYADTLNQLFGKEAADQARAMSKGENLFSDLGAPGLSLEGFSSHQRLLQAYQRLQTAKAAAID